MLQLKVSNTFISKYITCLMYSALCFSSFLAFVCFSPVFMSFFSSWCFCRFPGTVSVSSKFSVRTYSNNTISSNFTQRLRHWLFWGQKIWNLLFLVGSIFSISLFNFTLTLFHFGPKGGSLETEDKASGGEFCVFHILVMSTSTTGSCFYLSSFSKEKT